MDAKCVQVFLEPDAKKTTLEKRRKYWICNPQLNMLWHFFRPHRVEPVRPQRRVYAGGQVFDRVEFGRGQSSGFRLRRGLHRQGLVNDSIIFC